MESTLNFQIFNYIDLRANRSLDALVENITNIISNDNNEARDFVVLASTTKLLRNIDFRYRQLTKEQTETTFVSTEVLNRLKEIHNVTDEKLPIGSFIRILKRWIIQENDCSQQTNAA